MDEAARRKEVIARRETDVARWSDANQLEAAWDVRAREACRFLPSAAVVLDLGCGRMALGRFLPPHCRYLPCDLVARDERTLVCDFNREGPPTPQDVTHVVCLGVLEYLYDLPGFLARLQAFGRPVIVSYNPTDWNPSLDRRALGWVNDLGSEELAHLFDAGGFAMSSWLRIAPSQALLRLEPTPVPLPPSRQVLVISAYRVGNFGDRLGYHLINGVLPAGAVVHHAFFDFHDRCALKGVPDGDLDLIVLGVGNSMFAPLLTDELLRVLDRAPVRIGIFGTQYRAAMDEGRLRAVLDRLNRWYARYEEDVLLYGRENGNVVHLGDWLIDAFPLAKPRTDQLLQIGPWDLDNLSLDRTIQVIQPHRRVFSRRLHQLLCALTSAEFVGFHEQREAGSGEWSGKFRSMLLDVFGMDYPEDQMFPVNRDCVVAYKERVRKNVQGLRADLARLLYPGVGTVVVQP